MATMRCYVNIRQCRDVRGAVEYIELGLGEKRNRNRAYGTNRYAAMYCDSSSPNEFIKECQNRARHKRRTNEGYTLVVSPPLNTYDPNKPDDMRQMVNDVIEGGRRLYPGAKLFAGAHNDAEGHDECGGKPHVHLVVQNHDLFSGKALTKNRTAAAVRGEFNKLGAELGWAETELTHTRDQQRLWDKHRAVTELEAAKRVNNSERIAAAEKKIADIDTDAFGTSLMAKVLAARDAAEGETFEAWQSSFAEKCAENGVTFKTVPPTRKPGTKKPPSTKHGVVYAMRNEETKRVNRRKASMLSPALTFAGLQQFYREQQQLEAEQLIQPKTEAIPEPVAAESTETVERVAPAEVVEPVSAPAAIITAEQQQQLDAFFKGLERKRDRAEERVASAKSGDTTYKIQSKVAAKQNERLDILTAHRVNDDLHAALIQVETWQREDAEREAKKEAEKAQKRVNRFAMPETAPNAGIQRQHP